MLTLIFENASKEKALKLRDDLCESLVGIPGFIDNEIIINTYDLDNNTKEPLNEEGELIVIDNDGETHKHCVRLMIDSDNQPDGVVNHTMFIDSRRYYE